MASSRQVSVVAALGTAQTLAWASSYYLPAMLAAPMARDLGVSTPTVFAAFSVALVVSALLGPYAGRAIDRWGGRPVLAKHQPRVRARPCRAGQCARPAGLFAAWVILGIGMGSGLYEAAFAALVRLYGHGSRNAITGITLIAGFASTVGWPLSTLLELQIGWRGACYAWAALHLLVGLPLNLLLPKPRCTCPSPSPHPCPNRPLRPASPPPSMPRGRSAPPYLLALVFAATWFISTAMAAHLPRLLQAERRVSGNRRRCRRLVGPAQVAGRLLEFGMLQTRASAAVRPPGGG